MSRRGKLAPLRTALQWEEGARSFLLDPVLGLMEPPQAAVLELQKLAGFSSKVRALVGAVVGAWGVPAVGLTAGLG